MHLEWQGCKWTQMLNCARGKSQVRHKIAVEHVEMNQVQARVGQTLNFIAQARMIAVEQCRAQSHQLSGTIAIARTGQASKPTTGMGSAIRKTRGACN